MRRISRHVPIRIIPAVTAPYSWVFCAAQLLPLVRPGTLVGNKQQPETFSSKSEDRGDESPEDARIVQALASLNSELANAQRELARRNSELAAVIREKNQLLGMAAHDLRNPLGVIVGVVDMLGEELADSLSAENRELFSRVASSAEYMLGLIDEMLDYSKIDAGRLELELHPVNVTVLASASTSCSSSSPALERRMFSLSEPALRIFLRSCASPDAISPIERRRSFRKSSSRK